MSIHLYYNILGVSYGVSDEELKRAYRRRAKELHPDRNPSANAHEQFILLTEAYEYLINYKHQAATFSYVVYEHSHRQQQQRAEARRRAEEQARMEYEAFTKTDFYKSLMAVETLLTAVIQLLVILVMIAIPAVLAVFHGVGGIIAGIIVIAVTMPMVTSVFKVSVPFNISRFGNSVLYLVKREEAFMLFSIIFNLIIFFKIGMQTFISLYLLLQIYAVLVLGMFAYISRKGKAKSLKRRIFTAFSFAPLLISMLLIINLALAGHPVIEKYAYNYWVEGSDGLEQSTLVILENDRYREYTGVRCFMSLENLRKHSKVIMIVEQGALGFRVVKSYDFE